MLVSDTISPFSCETIGETNVSAGEIFKYDKNTAIYYEIEGDGDLPIVLLHGFGASHESWYDITPLLPHSDYTMFTIDLMGFGSSSKPRKGNYTLAEQANIVRALIDSLPIRNVVLAGQSYGGGVALMCALEDERRQSNLIGGLILLAAAAFPDKIPFFVRYLQSYFVGSLIMIVIPARIRAWFTLRNLFYDKSLVTRERVSRYAKYFTKAGTANSFVSAAQNIVPKNAKSLIISYKTLSIPVLIIWGESDSALPVGQAYRLNGLLKASSLTTIHACGHVPAEEKPQETAAAINLFLIEEIKAR